MIPPMVSMVYYYTPPSSSSRLGTISYPCCPVSFCLPLLPPLPGNGNVGNEIGCISLYRHAQTPSETIKAALAICNAHQRRFVGSVRVYRDVTIRWTKCIVNAKSGINFEREMRKRRGITLDMS